MNGSRQRVHIQLKWKGKTMKSMSRSILAGAVIALVHVAAANATEPSYQGYKGVIDNTGPAPVYKGTPVPIPHPIPETHSFYVRGDIGLGTHDVPELAINGVEFGQEDMNDVFTAGAGIGVYLRDSFRADITVDYRWDADVTGVNTVTGNQHTTEVDSILVLGNVYYDFLDRDRFTPYVGVGAGFVKHDSRDRRVFTNGQQVAMGDGADSSELALAAMAGFSYTIHKGLLVDAGYRYLYLGDTKTLPINNPQFGALEINEMQAHELRFGLRYEIY